MWKPTPIRKGMLLATANRFYRFMETEIDCFFTFTRFFLGGKLKVVGQQSSILIMPIPILTIPIPIPIPIFIILYYEALGHFHIIPHNVPAYILKRSLKSCSISIFFVIRIYRIIYSNISNETIWCGKHRILGFSMLLILAVNGPHKPKTFLLECDCMVLCLHMCVCVSFFQDACHQCLCFL